MTDIEKAIALTHTFANGDVAQAKDLLEEGYIQHNPSYGTGREAFLASVEALAQAPQPTTVETIRSFQDGDKVVLQSIYDFAGGGKQVAFDIFRIGADGKIAEHWDNLAPLAPPNPSGHTQTDGPTEPGAGDTKETKRIVSSFVQDVLRGEHPDRLQSFFDGNAYIQHNISMADGLSGLGDAMQQLAKRGIEMRYDHTYMVLGEGDWALAVSSGEFGGKPTSYYDLFRVKNGHIAEHWDVMQAIPPDSEARNSNGKF